jgi:serine/threonine-protein kinase HipA
MSARCLACYAYGADPDGFHRACARKLFPGGNVPTLDLDQGSLESMAARLVRARVALPGVQPKLSLGVVGHAGGERLTIVGLDGRYILKPPHPDFPGICELEDATMHLARTFGISTVPHTLLSMTSGERAYLAVRVDRDEGGMPLRMEDACQLSGQLTEHKYRGSLLKAARSLLAWSSYPQDDALRFWELAVFCFLSGNADMHLKNFSLLTASDGLTRLAPAYDLVPTALLMPDDREEAALTVNGRKAKLTRNDFVLFGQRLGLQERQLTNAFMRFVRGLEEVPSVLESSFLSMEERTAFSGLITERARRLDLVH